MLGLISGLVFLFPLFFLPWLPDPVSTAKGFFLWAFLLLAFFLKAISLLKKEKLTYSLALLDVCLVLFALVSFISWLFLPVGVKVRSLIQPLGLGSIIGFSLFYFLISQERNREKAKRLFVALILAGLSAGLITVGLFLVPDSALPWKFIFTPIWSPTGSSFILLQLLVPLVVILLVVIATETNRQKAFKRWWPIAAAIVILVSLAVSIYQTINKKPIILDWFSSWAIAVETFKRQPLLGVGPSNFNLAFNLYRPPEFNRSDHWNFRFIAPHSWVLQVWTELGLLGLVALILVFLVGWRNLKKRSRELVWFWLTTWLMVLIFPGNMINLFLLFLALSLGRGPGQSKSFSFIVGEKDRDIASIFWAILLFSLAGLGSYLLYRGVKSEVLLAQSLQAASQNRGNEVYRLQLAAIQTNRFLARSRIAFVQTNLALANSLAQSGQELTEERRGQIARLMNQTINEAKAVVALEPSNVVGWENLAQVYRQLINAVSGADQWAIVTYQQAVALDSLNPRLRVDYGGLLYSLSQYEEAAKQFEIAVNLKPDYANAWYNWAWALKQENKLEEAIQRLQQAVNLVAVNTPDYDKAKSELEDWKKELGQETVAQPESQEKPQELNPPQPLPSPKLEEPIKLPKEAAPPLESTSSAD